MLATKNYHTVAGTSITRIIGRSVEAGFYVFPLMANFGLAADVELWTVILSYFLGLQRLISCHGHEEQRKI